MHCCTLRGQCSAPGTTLQQAGHLLQRRLDLVALHLQQGELHLVEGALLDPLDVRVELLQLLGQRGTSSTVRV